MTSLVTHIATLPAYTAKLLLLKKEEISGNRAAFKQLDNEFGLNRDVLLEMEEKKLIKLQKCSLSWDIFRVFKSIAEKYTPESGGFPLSPSEVKNLGIDLDDWFYRESWPLGKKSYNKLKSIQHSEKTQVTISLEEMRNQTPFASWLSFEKFDPWFFLDFYLTIDSRKLKNFLSDYTKAYISSRIIEDKERMNYSKHREKIIQCLKNKIESGIDTNNLWLVPMEIWGEEMIGLIRPLEAVLCLEQDELITVKDIEDHWVDGDPYPWEVRLYFKISIPPKSLKRLNGSKKLVIEPRLLKMVSYSKGLISFQDDQDRKGKISFQNRIKGNKQEEIFAELWKDHREIRNGKIVKPGEDVTLENLKQITQNTNVQGINVQIDRLNNKFIEKSIKMRITSINTLRRRLEVEFLNEVRTRSERS